MHRKIIVLLLFSLCLITLFGCNNASPPTDRSIGQTNHPAIEPFIESANEFHIHFLLRNRSDVPLYYGRGYEVYRYEDGKWVMAYSVCNNTPSYSLMPGEVREYFVRPTDPLDVRGEPWPNEPMTFSLGNHLFARRIFTDPQDLTNYEYLRFEFEVTSWDEPQEREIPKKKLDFLLRGIASRSIVVSEVVVSQTGMTFYLENRSDTSYFYGQEWHLAQHIDGQWEPVPFVHDDPIIIFRIAYQLPGRSLQQYNIEWEHNFGALSPGKYRFLRIFTPDDTELPQGSLTREYVMIEFIIDENTPRNLMN